MRTFWENDGQPNDAGTFVATIDMEDGSGEQRFEGASHLEVANKLMQAQASATAKIRELTQAAKPMRPALVPQHRAIDADKRFEVATGVTDPDRAPEVIREVVEAELGVSLKDMRETMANVAEEQRESLAIAAAKAFMASTADYFPCAYNNKKLMGYMQEQQMDPTQAESYVTCFADLKEAGLLAGRPAEPNNKPEPTAQPGGLPEQSGQRTRQRLVAATGLRNGEFAQEAPAQSGTQKYTRQQIEFMSAADYRYKFENEPGFKELVNKL